MNDQWHSAGEELAMLLGDENAALAALDVKRAVSMLEAKAIAVMQFERLRPVQTEQAATVEMLGRLSLLAQENRRLLDRAIKAQKRVIGWWPGWCGKPRWRRVMGRRASSETNVPPSH